PLVCDVSRDRERDAVANQAAIWAVEDPPAEVLAVVDDDGDDVGFERAAAVQAAGLAARADPSRGLHRDPLRSRARSLRSAAAMSQRASLSLVATLPIGSPVSS